MKLVDAVWNLIDNGVYLLHVAACVLLAYAAIACPLFLRDLADEVRRLRHAVEAKEFTVECRHRIFPRGAE